MTTFVACNHVSGDLPRSTFYLPLASWQLLVIDCLNPCQLVPWHSSPFATLPAFKQTKYVASSCNKLHAASAFRLRLAFVCHMRHVACRMPHMCRRKMRPCRLMSSLYVRPELLLLLFLRSLPLILLLFCSPSASASASACSPWLLRLLFCCCCWLTRPPHSVARLPAALQHPSA